MAELPPGFILDSAPAQSDGLPPGFVLDNQPTDIGQGRAIQEGLLAGVPFSDEFFGQQQGNLDAFARARAEGRLPTLEEIRGTSEAGTQERRESRRVAEEQYPVTTAVASIVPAVAVPGGAMIRGAKTGAAVGAGYGGLYGAGEGTTPQERVEKATVGAGIGAAVGAPLGLLARGPAPQQLAGTTATGQQSVQAAERLGLEQFPRIAATESIPAKRIGLTASKVPWGGTPIQESIERSSQEVGKRVSRVADDFAGGTASSRAEAGSAARAGLTEFIGPTTSERVGKAYDAVDKLVNRRILSPLTKTAQTAKEIIGERGEAALRGTGTAVDEIGEALARPNGLTYDGIKKLRTSIGEMLKPSRLPANIDGGELKRIYAALSDDLRTAVQSAGGDKALSAFERANKLNSLVANRRKELSKLLGSKSDETLFDTIQRMAGSKGGADIELLAKARKAISQEEWNEVASAVISRLGQATKGNVETFSPARFLTEYGSLTDKGKAILFGSTGKTELRSALDDIQKVSERLADLGQYANPSGTAQMGIGTAFGAIGFAEAAFTGGLPMTTMAGLLGTRFVSTALSKPATARAMANWSRAYEALIRKPSQGTLAAFNAASRRFASDAGEALGLRAHVQQIAAALQGSAPIQAEGQKQ